MRFRPSDAHRWVAGGCTGSVRAIAAMPRTPMGPAAIEGVRLHSVAERMLLDAAIDCSEEDWKQVGLYVNDVRHTARNLFAKARVETKVSNEARTINGKVDADIMTPDRLIVWDYKSGRRQVEVVENRQLLIYAMLLRPGPPVGKTELRIVQPNGYHPDGPVRSWVVPDMRPYVAEVRDSMHEAEHDPRLAATPSNCTYCSAVTSCVAARVATLGGMDLGLTDTGPLPASALRAEVVQLRTAKKLLDIRLVAMEAEAKARMQKGENVVGCRLAAGQPGKLDWTADEARVRSTMTMMGVNPVVESLRTPTQMIDAGVPRAAVQALAKRRHPRMEVATDAAEQCEKIFS